MHNELRLVIDGCHDIELLLSGTTPAPLPLQHRTGEGLWLDNRGTPAWVPAELAKLQAAGRIAAPPF